VTNVFPNPIEQFGDKGGEDAGDVLPDTTLWRYMDLSKFVNMVSTSTLFFCRSDRLGDQFEGTIPLFTREKNEQEKRETLKKLRGEENSPFGFKTFGDRLDELEISKGRGRREKLRRRVFVNSWHANNYESAAMWKLYKSDVGIAIVSSVEKLSKAILLEPNASIDKIRYVDFEDEVELSKQDFNFPFLIKRISFAHEKEIRVIYKPQLNYSDLTDPKDFDLQERIEGFSFRVKLEELVSEIRVDPDSETWSYDTVRAILEKWNLNIPINRSNLGNDPIY